MNPSKRKGTDWESEVVSFLRQWWPHVERRALNGASDRGDITGIPGVVVECKAGATSCFPAWVREAELERANDGADVGVVFAKVRGKARARDGLVVMSPEQFAWLLMEAGWTGGPDQ